MRVDVNARLHFPGEHRANGVTPQDVAVAVAVEVADPGHLGGLRHEADAVAVEERTVLHLPHHHVAVLVTPQDVVVAIVVEIADAFDLVAVRGDSMPWLSTNAASCISHVTTSPSS